VVVYIQRTGKFGDKARSATVALYAVHHFEAASSGHLGDAAAAKAVDELVTELVSPHVVVTVLLVVSDLWRSRKP